MACSASDCQGSKFESCVWKAVSSHSFYYPQEVFLAQFSLYVHKGGQKTHSFHFISHVYRTHALRRWYKHRSFNRWSPVVTTSLIIRGAYDHRRHNGAIIEFGHSILEKSGYNDPYKRCINNFGGCHRCPSLKVVAFPEFFLDLFF